MDKPEVALLVAAGSLLWTVGWSVFLYRLYNARRLRVRAQLQEEGFNLLVHVHNRSTAVPVFVRGVSLERTSPAGSLDLVAVTADPAPADEGFTRSVELAPHAAAEFFLATTRLQCLEPFTEGPPRDVWVSVRTHAGRAKRIPGRRVLPVLRQLVANVERQQQERQARARVERLTGVPVWERPAPHELPSDADGWIL